MNEGDNGRLVRNALVEAMWEDVEFKSKKIGVKHPIDLVYIPLSNVL